MNSDPSCLSGLSFGACQQLPHSEGTHHSLGQAGLARGAQLRGGEKGGGAWGSLEPCSPLLPNRSVGKRKREFGDCTM